MSAAVSSTVTVGGVLFPTEKPEDALAHLLQSAGTIAEIVGHLHDPSLHLETARRGAQLLDLDVADVLVAAWRTGGELKAEARSTEADPGTTKHVKLVTQRVAWTWSPSIHLVVDGWSLGAIKLKLELAFEIGGLEAAVRGGRLVDLDAGDCELTASLSVQGGPPLTRKAEFPLRVAVPLPASGIPLLRSADHDGPPPAAANGAPPVELTGRAETASSPPPSRE